MESTLECTLCGVAMTGWSAPGSPTRYHRCPRCNRTIGSPYGEGVDHGALARRREPAVARRFPSWAPNADDAQWRELKGRADRWFARLEADEQAHAPERRRPRRSSVLAIAGVVRARP